MKSIINQAEHLVEIIANLLVEPYIGLTFTPDGFGQGIVAIGHAFDIADYFQHGLHSL